MQPSSRRTNIPLTKDAYGEAKPWAKHCCLSQQVTNHASFLNTCPFQIPQYLASGEHICNRLKTATNSLSFCPRRGGFFFSTPLNLSVSMSTLINRIWIHGSQLYSVGYNHLLSFIWCPVVPFCQKEDPSS